MNKADVIDRLTMRIGDKRVAEAALDGLVDIITRSVTSGEKVSITGFGTFEKVDRKARKARNPRTGEAVRVGKSSAPKFRPGSVFKGAVNGTTKLGREMKAAPLLPSGITGTRMLSKVTGTAASSTSTAAASPGTAKRTARKTSTAKATTRGAKKTAGATRKSAAPARKAATRKTAAKASSRTATTAKPSTRKASTGRASARKTSAKTSTARRRATR